MRPDRGSASVWLLTAAGVLCLAVLTTLAATAAAVAQRQVDAAADATALAGAREATALAGAAEAASGPAAAGSPCGVAAVAARRLGVALTSCSATGLVVAVTVAAPPPTWLRHWLVHQTRIFSRSRAGPTDTVSRKPG